MLTKLLLIIAAVAGQTSPVTPNLRIDGIDPPSAGKFACELRVTNLYTHRALTWVLLEPNGGRSWIDNATIPDAGIPPQGKGSLPYSCPESMSHDVTIAAVQYDDGSVGGDVALFERTVQPWRDRNLAGLQELVAVLAGVDLRLAAEGRVEAVLRQVIDNASGPSITVIARGYANNGLRRARATGEQRAEPLRALLLAEIKHEAEMVQRFRGSTSSVK
jgi:hypothetical protein